MTSIITSIVIEKKFNQTNYAILIILAPYQFEHLAVGVARDFFGYGHATNALSSPNPQGYQH
jgi:hypothetical protein